MHMRHALIIAIYSSHINLIVDDTFCLYLNCNNHTHTHKYLGATYINSIKVIIIIIFYFKLSPRTSREQLGENEFAQKKKEKKNIKPHPIIISLIRMSNPLLVKTKTKKNIG